VTTVVWASVLEGGDLTTNALGVCSISQRPPSFAVGVTCAFLRNPLIWSRAFLCYACNVAGLGLADYFAADRLALICIGGTCRDALHEPQYGDQRLDEDALLAAGQFGAAWLRGADLGILFSTRPLARPAFVMAVQSLNIDGGDHHCDKHVLVGSHQCGL